MKYMDIKSRHQANCSRCLDSLQNHAGVVDLWDCKPDSNQVWQFAVSAGASLVRRPDGCLFYQGPR